MTLPGGRAWPHAWPGGIKKPLGGEGSQTPILLGLSPIVPSYPGWHWHLGGVTRLPGASSGQDPLRLS